MAEDLAELCGQNIPLFEMIQTLRQELQASIAISKDAPLRFALEAVELELRVAVTRGTKGDAKFKFWVVEAGAEASKKSDQIHVFKLKLQPVGPDGVGESVLVTDQGKVT